jgi:ATP-dependent Clp protease ATP-binding subunit ClpA
MSREISVKVLRERGEGNWGINLHNYYIVFTSNIGAGDAMRMESSAFATIERTVLRKVAQVLRPELVARISEKIVFGRLNYAIQREICEL